MTDLNIYIFVKSANKTDTSFIGNFLRAYGIVGNIQIFPLDSYDYKKLVGDAQVIMCFGNEALHKELQELHISSVASCLPPISQISDKKNKETRQQADSVMKKLQGDIIEYRVQERLREIEKSVGAAPGSLELTKQNIISLTRHKAITKLENGKSVEVVQSNKDFSGNADIGITFPEVEVLREVMDVLGVEKLDIQEKK